MKIEDIKIGDTLWVSSEHTSAEVIGFVYHGD